MIWETTFGQYTLYAIEDGHFQRGPMEVFPTSDQEVWDDNAQFLTDGKIRVSYGCFLLAGPDDLVMIDTGAGPPQPWAPPETVMGQMPAALGAIGADPADVRTVIHTHLHFDHWGGNFTAEGDLFFPNAEYLVHRKELDYWMVAGEGAGPEEVREQFGQIVNQGKVVPIDGSAHIGADITVDETFGHTPGHISVIITSGDSRTLIAGDAAHHPLQAEHSHWNVAFDMDKPLAAFNRERLFKSLADSGTLFAGGHFPRPGIGHVRAADDKRFFVMADIPSRD